MEAAPSILLSARPLSLRILCETNCCFVCLFSSVLFCFQVRALVSRSRCLSKPGLEERVLRRLAGDAVCHSCRACLDRPCVNEVVCFFAKTRLFDVQKQSTNMRVFAFLHSHIVTSLFLSVSVTGWIVDSNFNFRSGGSTVPVLLVSLWWRVCVCACVFKDGQR